MSASTVSSLVIPVILCGGSGARLWPLSRSGFPKQFLALPGDDSNQSLFQKTVLRINANRNAQINLGETLIVTNEDHRFLVLDQLREMDDIQATLLLEPVGRNTAPALTIASLYAKETIGNTGTDSILVVTPADQIIQNRDSFTQALQNCITVVEGDVSNQSIAIMGITPTGPETGYGYLKRVGKKGNFGEYAVEQFAEKPNLEKVVAYLKDRNYF